MHVGLEHIEVNKKAAVLTCDGKSVVGARGPEEFVNREAYVGELGLQHTTCLKQQEKNDGFLQEISDFRERKRTIDGKGYTTFSTFKSGDENSVFRIGNSFSRDANKNNNKNKRKINIRKRYSSTDEKDTPLIQMFKEVKRGKKSGENENGTQSDGKLLGLMDSSPSSLFNEAAHPEVQGRGLQ